DNLNLDGDGFGFSGSAKLSPTYGLIEADIDHFALHPGDSVAFQLTRTKTGYSITAHGSSFDMRSVISRVRDLGDNPSSTPDLTVDARVDKMIGFNDQVLTGGKVSFVAMGGSTQKLVFSGTLGGQDASINYTDLPEGGSLVASVGDAGGLLRF